MRVYVFLLFLIIATPSSACSYIGPYDTKNIHIQNLQLTMHTDVLEVDLYKFNDFGQKIKTKTISIDFLQQTVSSRQLPNRAPVIDEQYEIRYHTYSRDTCSPSVRVLFAEVNNTMEPVITMSSPYTIDPDANLVYRMFRNEYSGNYHLERYEIGSEWSFQHRSTGIAGVVMIISVLLIQALYNPPSTVAWISLILIGLYIFRKRYRESSVRLRRSIRERKSQRINEFKENNE